MIAVKGGFVGRQPGPNLCNVCDILVCLSTSDARVISPFGLALANGIL